jgi:hypothetical protein
MAEVQMHEYVGVILDAAKMEKDKFVVPAPALESFTKQLRSTHVEDTSLFVHLVVAAARVKKSGLLALSQQLVELAKIGLDHKLLENEQQNVTTRGRAAHKTIDDAPTQSGAGTLKRGTSKGVGMRSGGSVKRKS